MSYEDLDIWKRAARLSVRLHKEIREHQISLKVMNAIMTEIFRILNITKGSASELRTKILIRIEAEFLDCNMAIKWADEAQ